MKTCSYCGRQNNDDSLRCSECGTAFNPGTNKADAGATADQATKLMILRRFTSEIAAQAAAATLTEAHIFSTVSSDDCGGMLMPLATATGGYQLLVNATDAAEAERALREIEDRPPDPQLEESYGSGPTPAPLQKNLRGFLPGLLLGLAVGGVAVWLYLDSRRHLNGTQVYDSNHDGRADEWYYYVGGVLDRVVLDRNHDGKPDAWYFYHGHVLQRDEADQNFDGKVDSWGTYSNGSLESSQGDVDFDGKPDVTFRFVSGVVVEANWRDSTSGVLWKKGTYRQGLLREELIDTNRDGKFDEKILYDSFGTEVQKSKPD